MRSTQITINFNIIVPHMGTRPAIPALIQGHHQPRLATTWRQFQSPIRKLCSQKKKKKKKEQAERLSIP